jgi:trk system potassium uptake protein TrkA
LLTVEGHNVVVIDRRESAFDRLGTAFNGITLQGIAFDEEVLLEAGIEEADIFAAVTNYDNTNLMAAQIAANIYHVPRTIARLYNPDKESTFRRLQINYICGTTMVAERVMKRILETGEQIHLDRPDLGVKVMEFRLAGKGAGMSVAELESPGQVRVIAVLRDGTWSALAGELALEAGNRLVVSATASGLAFLKDLIEPEAARGACCP